MELTYEQAEVMLQDRLAENPAIQNLVSADSFKKTLADLISFEGIDPAFIQVIEYEILLTLARYAPISELAENIVESTGMSTEKAEDLVIMIESTLLSPVYEDLVAFDAFWKEELAKEPLMPIVSEPVHTTSTPTLPKIEEPIASGMISIDISKVIEPEPVPTPIQSAPIPPIIENFKEETSVPVISTPRTMPSLQSKTPEIKIPEKVPEPVLPVANKNFREKLEFRPAGVVARDMPIEEAKPQDASPKPLTREEVMKALAPRRTMAADIERIRQSKGEATDGYAAFQNNETPNTPQ